MLIGIGDSATVRQIGIIEELEKKGFNILNPFSRRLAANDVKITAHDDISRKIFACDVLLTGTNAITSDGKLINVDAVGNRVASMIFGPRKVYIVAGRNKIVKDIDEAFYRIKSLIAPFHARTKDLPTPCAQVGKCVDCNVPMRICNVTSIMEKRPWRTEILVVLVDADLGLGWDERWNEARIQKIKSNYERVTWRTSRSYIPT